MSVDFDISFAPEILSEGTPEECAAFGLFTIRTAQKYLTEGFDHFLGSSRVGPMVSAYHAAEWFIWNWWRLRWEPRRAGQEWELAHRMTSIGEGYTWPNITMFSDGERTALISSPSTNPDAKPFRYFGAISTIVASRVFETAIDDFVVQVLSRLETQGVEKSNLHHLWSDILAERDDPAIAQRRKIEAMLGREPDEVEDDRIERLIGDAAQLGERAVEEVAADQEHAAAAEVPLMYAQEFQAAANTYGFDANTGDAARLLDAPLPMPADVPAWRLGAMAAQLLRKQESLGFDKISNIRLAGLAGTRHDVLAKVRKTNLPMSYTLLQDGQRSKVVLRSKWEDGRRFDLARLICDNVLNLEGRLHPATRAYTYRQKAQRSFAAEFLSPFHVVDDMLNGDYSLEAQQDVARHFSVSEMTINTLLKNHGRIERDDPEQYNEILAA